MTDLININSPTTPVAVTTVSAATAFVGGKGSSGFILIDNTLTANTDCYVKTGLAGVVATTADTHIAANEKATYEIDPDHTHIACITPTGTTNLRIQRGAGA
jgi:hypothetical protein